MRLFGKIGGTRAQFRAAFQTMPFDFVLPIFRPVNGPLIFPAATIYRPGAQQGAAYRLGAKQGEIYRPGAMHGEVSG